MKLLLDTCSLLWLTHEPARFPLAVQRALRHPGSIAHISALSAWELGIKAAKGKLLLPERVSAWFPAVVQQYALTELAISGAIAALSTELPPIHADPFDRILIATAQHYGLTLLTPDHTILQYPGLTTLW